MTELVEFTDDFGYKSVHFSSKNDRKPVKRFSNRVVYAAFCPDFDRSLEIDHMDLDPSNNAIDNLQALSSYDNLVKPRALDAPRYAIVDNKFYEPPLDRVDKDENSWVNIGMLGQNDFGDYDLPISGNQRHTASKQLVRRTFETGTVRKRRTRVLFSDCLPVRWTTAPANIFSRASRLAQRCNTAHHAVLQNNHYPFPH
ncbi:hypothetical protein BC940DRAFT_153592 [Gongronella butleri]|nr:hypothetical protein BC940DRAFT_153592 [Gongronella butleri]